MNSYVQCRDEIVKRKKFIQDFYVASLNRFPEPVVAETIGLQIRKILELIAKASLVANRTVLADVSLWFKRDWNAKDILERIEKVNPDFYPDAVREKRVYQTGNLKAEWEDAPGGICLSKDEFIDAYDTLGDLLHARDPSDPIDFRKFLEKTQGWESKIHELLGMHKIRLLGSDTFCLVQMNVNGSPKWSQWIAVEPSDQNCAECGDILYKSKEGLLCSNCMQQEPN